MAQLLEATRLEEALTKLDGWSPSQDGKSICREFKFKTFVAAFGFMSRVALLAEKADHHPDWSNSYNKVSVTLSTHSAGGVTEKDIALAEAINAVSA